MKPTNHPYFSLKKVQSDLNGKLAVTDEMTFNDLDNYTEEKRK
jgi:galactose mutarotase-like enzyme